MVIRLAPTPARTKANRYVYLFSTNKALHQQQHAKLITTTIRQQQQQQQATARQQKQQMTILRELRKKV